MKKAILSLVVLFSLATFAVNPVSVNPVSINLVNVLKFEQKTNVKLDSKITLESQTWLITCVGSGNPRSVSVETNSYTEATALAGHYCGSRGWYMGRTSLTVSSEETRQ